MLPYTTPEEFSQRVLNTVILLDKQPIYITNVSAASRLSYVPLPLDGNRHDGHVQGDDPRLDAHNFKLGYCNVTGPSERELPYLSRMPVRQGHQGLQSGNVFVPPASGMNLDTLMRYQHFVDMLNGHYPPFNVTKQLISERGAVVKQVAFDRRWSLVYSNLEIFYLHYKGKVVASSTNGESFHLPRNAQYLQQALEAKGLRVA